MEDQENQSIEVDEVVEVVTEAVDLSELPKEERDLIEKHGLIPEVDDGDNKEQPKAETSEDKEEVDEVEEVDTDPDNFDSMEKVLEKDEDKFHKTFSSNQKALYFKNKRYKERTQEAEKIAEELTAEKELNSLKASVNGKRVTAIEQALKDPDLTIEKLQSIINGEVAEAPQGEKKFSKAEYDAIRQQEEVAIRQQQDVYAKRVSLAEQIGKSKYENFDDITILAQEVIANDKTGIKQEILSKVFTNKSIDEEQIVDAVIEMAQLSPKFKDTMNNASSSDKENVGRAIKNSGKKKSSASVTGGKGRKVINHDDLTINDIASMTTKDYMKIPKKVRDRILLEAG